MDLSTNRSEISALEALGSEFARLAKADAQRRRRSWLRRHWVLVAAAIAVFVPASAIAVRALVAEPGSAGDAFTHYINGVKPKTWPGAPYVGEPPASGAMAPTRRLVEEGLDPRVLARRGRLGLYVAKTDEGPGLYFEWPGVGLGMGRSTLYRIAHQKVASLGPGGAIHGLTPLYGVSDDEVATVRMTYAHGPASPEAKADGGFILMVDSTRNPQTIEGLDSDGNVIGEAAAGGWWRDEARNVGKEQRKKKR